MNPAITVIDMQVDFFDKPRLRDCQHTLIANINALTAFGRAATLPVIWVRTIYQPDMSDANRYLKQHNITMLVKGTKGSALLPGLHTDVYDHHLVKKRYSAFFRTELDTLLAKLDVDALIVAGINTHACVRTTVIDAYQRDYPVAIAADCVNSYDGEHHDLSLRYMNNKVCDLLTNAQIQDRFS